MPTTEPNTDHAPCQDVIELRVKVAMLETWKDTTTADLKAISDVISQVKLLMSLSIGGGALSLVALVVAIAKIAGP